MADWTFVSLSSVKSHVVLKMVAAEERLSALRALERPLLVTPEVERRGRRRRLLFEGEEGVDVRGIRINEPGWQK